MITTTRLPVSHRPPHLRSLSWLLSDLGVPKTKKPHYKGGYVSHLKRSEAYSFSVLWDKFESAKSFYRQQVWRAHPDRGGSHEECARLNSVWTVLRARFAARGVGID